MEMPLDIFSHVESYTKNIQEIRVKGEREREWRWKEGREGGREEGRTGRGEGKGERGEGGRKENLISDNIV